MFEKVNILNVFKEHYKTLYEITKPIGKEAKKSPRLKDLLLFFGIPMLLLLGVILIFYWHPIILNGLALTIISASSAAFFALMLTAIFSIIDRSDKLSDKIQEAKSNNISAEFLTKRKEVLKELYYNVSYSIIMALALIILSIIAAMFSPDGACPQKITLFIHTVFSGIIIAVGVNLILTLLMVIKRVCKLFEPE